MNLDDLTRPNLTGLLGLGLAAIALPALLPELRPALRSMVRAGAILFAEAEAEAEAELIEWLVAATLRGIADVLSTPVAAGEQRQRYEAVGRRVQNFQRQARQHAHRWAGDEPARRRTYRRHVARLEAELVRHKERVGPARQRIIDETVATLAKNDLAP